MSKITFKEQLKWSAWGIMGFFIPALTSFYYAEKSVAIAAGCALLSIVSGVFMGSELRDKYWVDIVDEQSNRIDRLFTERRELKKEIDALRWLEDGK